MKKPFYSLGAKITVMVIMLAAAAVSAASFAWMLVGADNSYNRVSSIIHPKPYEESAESAEYINYSGEQLLSILSGRYYFYKDGKFDVDATVNLSDEISGTDWKKGISKGNKQQELEYRIGDLVEFRDTIDYLKLQYLVDNGSSFVYSDASSQPLGPDADAADVTTINMEEDSWFSDNMLNDNDTNGIALNLLTGNQWNVKCYSSLFNVLYNNGIVIEKDNIISAADTTLAEYALTNHEDVSIYDCYKALLQLSDSAYYFYEYMEKNDSSDCNGMYYFRDTRSGSVVTNVKEWEKFSLEEVKSDYLSGPHKSSWVVRPVDGISETSVTDVDAASEWRNISEFLLSYYLDQFPASSSSVELFAGLDGEYPVNDDAKNSSEFTAWYAANTPFGSVLPFFIAGMVIAAVMLILAGVQTGRISADRMIHPVSMDRFPIELLILIDIIAWIMWLAMFFFGTGYCLGYGRTASSISFAYVTLKRLLILLISWACCGCILMTWNIKHYGRRIKERSIGGSLIRNLVRVIAGLGRNFYQSRQEHRKIIIVYVVFAVVQAFLMGMCGLLFSADLIPLALIFFIITVCLDIYVLNSLLRTTRGREETKKGMQEITRGNLDYKIDVEQTYGYTKTIAEGINGIGEGLKNALEAEMRSERMKTDLITNVSHDIKTPLTSIINYVDLLKRENITDEPVAGYIEVLDRKSARLKQLVNDLVESSKISSGNIKLDLMKLDLKQLILQANVEFEEKFAERELELIADLSKEPLHIIADSARMYRVIENLYNNAAKYAMPRSRVYITAGQKSGRIEFTIKNMSEYALNIDADELMERFVRGDMSRTTEGSGLGLEIARNLTVMQKGTFDIQLDGDLFKVILTFPPAAE